MTAPVILASGEGEEQIPRLHVARVAGQPRDDGFPFSGDREERDTLQKRFQRERNAGRWGLGIHDRAQWMAAVESPAVPDWAITFPSSAGRSR